MHATPTILLLVAAARSVSSALLASSLPLSGLDPLGPCVFTNAEVGWTWDLSPLAGARHSWTDGGSDYAFTLCAALPTACVGRRASAAQLDPLSPNRAGCLASLGAADSAEAVPFAPNATAGFALTYFGGAACGPPPGAYATRFALSCDAALARGALAVDSVSPPDAGGCVLEVTARSAAACPTRYIPVVRGLGAGWLALAVAAACGALYCGAGAAYKRAKRGARGLESIPHIDTWRACMRTCACRGGGTAQYAPAATSDAGGDYAAMAHAEGEPRGVDAGALTGEALDKVPPAMSAF